MSHRVSRTILVVALLFTKASHLAAQPLDWAMIGPVSELSGFGTGPAALALNDMDGDGDSDMVCCNRVSNTVAVFRNNGSGNFSHIHTYTLGGGVYPSDIFFADLDGSSPADILVTNYQSGSFTRRRGNGDGSFGAPTVVPIGAAGAQPWSIAARRLRPSGPLVPTARDVVVTDPGNNLVWVFPANASGASSPYDTPFSLSASGNPDDLAIDDIDDDGDQDIIISVNGNPSYIKVFGNTNSSFLTASQFPSSLRTLTGGASFSEFRGFAIGQLVGDARKDIAVVQWLSPRGSVEIFRGAGPNATGGPTFVHHASLPAGELTRDVVITDVDGDGDSDVVAIDAGDGTLNVFANNGSGQFRNLAVMAMTHRDTDPLPVDVAVNDFDGDGLPEFVASMRNSNVIRTFKTVAGSEGMLVPSALPIINGGTMTISVGFGTTWAGALWMPLLAIEPVSPAYPVQLIDPGTSTYLAMSLQDPLFNAQLSLVASSQWSGPATLNAAGTDSISYTIPPIPPNLLPLRIRVQPLALKPNVPTLPMRALIARILDLI